MWHSLQLPARSWAFSRNCDERIPSAPSTSRTPCSVENLLRRLDEPSGANQSEQLSSQRMFFTRALLKKLIACLLPMSFVWVLVACVSICARDCAALQASNPIFSSTDVEDSSDCKGCPLTAVPKAIMPERAINGFDVQLSVVIGPPLRRFDSPADDSVSGSRQRQPSTTDPPSKRLPVLRV